MGALVKVSYISTCSVKEPWFTLFELLIVLVIIGLTLGLVVPQGYNVLNRAKRHIARLEDVGFRKKAVFEAFILDAECHMARSSDQSSLVCEDRVVLEGKTSENLDNLRISNKGLQRDTRLEGVHSR